MAYEIIENSETKLSLVEDSTVVAEAQMKLGTRWQIKAIDGTPFGDKSTAWAKDKAEARSKLESLIPN
jgi:hypothetical protein